MQEQKEANNIQCLAIPYVSSYGAFHVNDPDRSRVVQWSTGPLSVGPDSGTLQIRGPQQDTRPDPTHECRCQTKAAAGDGYDIDTRSCLQQTRIDLMHGINTNYTNLFNAKGKVY